MEISDWFEYEGVTIRRLGRDGAYTYRTAHVALDADGSPRAYRPDGKGLDANANAGYPHKGWRGVLAVDPHDPSEPYVQPDGPFAGCFVSKTSLRDRGKAETDVSAYVNAETVPYIVFPGAFYSVRGTGRYGDLLMTRRVGDDHGVAAIVADGGPTKAPLGEMSLALATALGGRDPDPRTGRNAPEGTFEYVIFPGSVGDPAWPRSPEDIDRTARELLHALGGWPSNGAQ